MVNILKTTVPLGSYIRKSLIFLYYASPGVKILKENWGYQKNLGESRGLILRHLTEKSEKCTLATSNIRLLLFFGEVDQ